MTTNSKMHKEENRLQKFIRSNVGVITTGALLAFSIASISCSGSNKNDTTKDQTQKAAVEMAVEQPIKTIRPDTPAPSEAPSYGDVDKNTSARIDDGVSGAKITVKNLLSSATQSDDQKSVKNQDPPYGSNPEPGTLKSASPQNDTNDQQQTDGPADTQQQDPQQQQTDPDPIQTQTLIVQEPVFVQGYGTLGMGYGIPYCPVVWNQPWSLYPYSICNGWWGGRPFLRFWGRGGWENRYYNRGEFGRFFSNNVANRNNLGVTNNNTARGAQQQKGQASETQSKNGWSHFNGQKGSPQNLNRQASTQRNNMESRSAQRPNAQSGVHNNMLRQQPQVQQHFNMPQQRAAPVPHYSAPPSHAATGGGGGHAAPSHGSSGRRR
jgi:hypothetical protein